MYSEYWCCLQSNHYLISWKMLSIQHRSNLTLNWKSLSVPIRYDICNERLSIWFTYTCKYNPRKHALTAHKHVYNICCVTPNVNSSRPTPILLITLKQWVNFKKFSDVPTLINAKMGKFYHKIQKNKQKVINWIQKFEDPPSLSRNHLKVISDFLLFF